MGELLKKHPGALGWSEVVFILLQILSYATVAVMPKIRSTADVVSEEHDAENAYAAAGGASAEATEAASAMSGRGESESRRFPPPDDAGESGGAHGSQGSNYPGDARSSNRRGNVNGVRNHPADMLPPPLNIPLTALDLPAVGAAGGDDAAGVLEGDRPGGAGPNAGGGGSDPASDCDSTADGDGHLDAISSSASSAALVRAD